MNKLTRTLALVGMLAVASGTLSVADAQEPKAKKTAKKSGTVKVKQSDKNDRFYFSVYDADDKYIAGGPAKGFDTKKDAADAVEALKAALDGAKMEYVKGADDKEEVKKEEPKTKKKGEEPKKEKKGG